MQYSHFGQCIHDEPGFGKIDGSLSVTHCLPAALQRACPRNSVTSVPRSSHPTRVAASRSMTPGKSDPPRSAARPLIHSFRRRLRWLPVRQASTRAALCRSGASEHEDHSSAALRLGRRTRRARSALFRLGEQFILLRLLAVHQRAFRPATSLERYHASSQRRAACNRSQAA